MNTATANSFPRGFDAVTLNHFLWYKHQCHECTSAEFQRLFENIIKRARPEFIQIRPYGNIGDRKCDGLFAVEGTVFQVYSPDEFKLAEVKRKIDEDLRLAVTHWAERMKEWVFVYNVRRGLAPDIPALLLSKKETYPKLTIDHLSSDALWEITRDLSLQQRAEILGAPLGYEHLFFTSTITDADVHRALKEGSFVIVHDTMAPINLQSVTEALKPGAPFGAPTHIRPTPGPLPWTEAAEYQRHMVLDAVEKSRDILPRFAVFSLSQIALCIHLGFVISDRLDVRCFQFDRDERTWLWPTLEAEPDLTISVTGMPEIARAEPCEVIIRVNLSAAISPDTTHEAAGHQAVEIDISVSAPDVMWLRSPKQLIALSRTFRGVLSDLRRLVPRSTRIHLFYAGPTGGAVVVGQQINPRMNPPVELYEYSQQTVPNHQRALTLQ